MQKISKKYCIAACVFVFVAVIAILVIGVVNSPKERGESIVSENSSAAEFSSSDTAVSSAQNESSAVSSTVTSSDTNSSKNSSTTSSENQDTIDSTSSSSNNSANSSYFYVPKYGKYVAEMWWNSDNSLYMHITIEKNNTFMIDSNVSLEEYDQCSPFVKKGTYTLENTSFEKDEHNIGSNLTWLNLYYDGKLIRTYVIGENGNTFNDQEIVFNYVN